MKKHFLTLLALAFLMSIAVAQPAMMTKGQVGNSTQVDTTLTCQESLNNRLDVEIVSEYGERFHHPQHPEIGQTCPFIVWFTTNHQYAWYQWETTLPNWEMWNDYVFHSDVFSSGYIKVTVGDNYGNTGTDSIWFNVKDHVSPLGSFIMELGDDLYPTFSGIATPEHYRIFIGRGFTPGQSIHHENFFLSPGEWVYKDVNAIYNEDTLWIYNIMILDTCMLNQLYTQYIIPGLLLNTSHENEKWYLSPKTILQTDNGYYQSIGHSFVYFIYTIDEYGNKIHFQDENGNPIILPPETTSWQIPIDKHDHPYYQCGVARVLDDGGYELLSLSNKVVNPYYFETLRIEDIEESHTYDYCLDYYGDMPFVVLYGDPNCPQQVWERESSGEHYSQNGDSIVIANPHETLTWDVVYHGCDKEVSFHIMFYAPTWDNPFEESIMWKHYGETAGLTAIDDEVFASDDIGCLWSTGDTTNRIVATETGPYSVVVSAHSCMDTYSVEVRDNVEASLVTVDLKTGKDKVFWQVMPEQAEYVNEVKICTDVGSTYRVPYDRGYYLLGIEDTPRNYRIIAVSKEGEDSTVASYEKGTVHATCHESLDGIITLNWNIPYIEQGSLVELIGFQICKYDSSSEEVTVVEELAATATDYTGDLGPFVGCRAVVAALFSNGERAFSNVSTMLAVDENMENGFTIYPNPAQGRFTVEGSGHLTVSNILGQTVMSKEIDGAETLELPRGLYFLKMGAAVRKMVVE